MDSETTKNVNIMPIDGLGPTQPPPSGPFPGLSPTDQRVHLFAGNLLMLIGMAFACTAVFVHTPIPMGLAVGSPLTLVVAGMLLVVQSYFSQPPVTPPLGLNNLDENCWINVFLQLLCHVPSLAPLLDWENQAGDATPFKTACETLRQDPDATNGVSSVDTNDLRATLCDKYDTFDRNPNVPDDPMELVTRFLDETGQMLPIMQQTTRRTANDSTAGEATRGLEHAIAFPPANQPFSEVLNAFFSSHSDVGDGQTIAIEKWFETAPPGIFFQVQRAQYEDQGRNGTPVQFDEHFSLTDAQCPSGPASYSVKAIIEHTGKGREAGHYVIYLNMGGRVWYRVSDRNVEKTSHSQIQAKLSNASIVYYGKVLRGC